MASDEIAAAIQDYLTTSWTSCPLAYENDGYEPPDNTPWAYVEFMGTAWVQDTIGAGPIRDNRFTEEGLVMLHVFVPKGTGSNLIRQYARQLADLFRGAELLAGTLWFKNASIGAGNPGSEDGKWWRMTATIEFERNL